MLRVLLLLGIIVGASIISGVGVLAPEIENIWVQNIGVGENDIISPIEVAGVDLSIDPFLGNNNLGESVFKNRFVACSFHSGENPMDGPLSAVICKLTGEDGEAIAEGRLNFCADTNLCPQGEYMASQEYFINNLQEAYSNALILGNVVDIRLIVIGDSVTNDFIITP